MVLEEIQAALSDFTNNNVYVELLIYSLVIILGIVIIIALMTWINNKKISRERLEQQKKEIVKHETIPEPNPELAESSITYSAMGEPINNINIATWDNPETVSDIKSDSDMVVTTTRTTTTEAKSVKPMLCPVCNGRGEVFRLPKEIQGKVQLGDKADYSTQYAWMPCPACDGKGYIVVPET